MPTVTFPETLVQCACEFVGTFFLVLAVGCNTLGGTSAAWASTSIACVLMVMVYAVGPISGGHLNPAVSLAAGLTGKHPWHLVAVYAVVQVAAGVSAGFCNRALFGGRSVSLSPGAGFDLWDAAVVEVLYTGMLAFVVLSVAYSARNNPEGNPNQFYGLAIGFVVIAGATGAGPISGGCFNPAVALGIDISSYQDGVSTGFFYAAFEAVGALLAAAIFVLTRPEEFGPRAEVEFGQVSLPTKLASEFVGTFLLVLTVGLNVLGGSKACAWSAAAALMSMVYALGDVSGAHFNPAVTLAVVLSKKGGCTVREGLTYAVTQVVAGVLAAVLYSGLHKATTFPLGPKGVHTGFAAYIVEFVFTCVLALAVLTTACTKGITSKLSRNYYFALAIGSCVTAGGVAAGNVSGGILNPAVSVGVAVSDTAMSYGTLYYCLSFCAVQIVGGFFATLIFYVTHASEYVEKVDPPLVELR